VSLLAWYGGNLHGCTAGTLVFEGKKLVPIEKLCAGFQIIGITPEWQFVKATMRCAVLSEDKQPCVKLVFDDGDFLVVAYDQKFFLSDRQEWIAAENLEPGVQLAYAGETACRLREVVDGGRHKVWHIDVGEPHTFFIGRQLLLTHNTSCVLYMEYVQQSALNASLAGGLGAFLAAEGIAFSMGSGFLLFTAPFSWPAFFTIAGSSAVAYGSYYAFHHIAGAIALKKARAARDAAEAAPDVAALRQQQSSTNKKSKNNKQQPNDQPPKNNKNEPPDNGKKALGDIAKVKTANDVYEFIKERWRACKDACHNAISELSKISFGLAQAKVKLLR